MRGIGILQIPLSLLAILVSPFLLVQGLAQTPATQTKEQKQPAAPPRQVIPSAIYRLDFRTERERVGVTKNVEVEQVPTSGDNYTVKFRALKDNQFALWKATSSEEAKPTRGKPDPTERLVLPSFLPGDSGIHVKVASPGGFTQLFSLKILDPVVLAVRPDGTIEADREGVRAVQHVGTVFYPPCFLVQPKAEEGVYYIEPFSKYVKEQDVLVLYDGQELICEADMKGEDGKQYITHKIQLEGKLAIVFVRVATTQ